jgi:hypothetical protein
MARDQPVIVVALVCRTSQKRARQILFMPTSTKEKMCGVKNVNERKSTRGKQPGKGNDCRRFSSHNSNHDDTYCISLSTTEIICSPASFCRVSLGEGVFVRLLIEGCGGRDVHKMVRGCLDSVRSSTMSCDPDS